MGSNASSETKNEWEKLEELDYSSKSLQDLFSIDLALFKNLRIINICRNNLTTLVGISQLAPTLQEIDLSHNPLQTISDELFMCNSLKKLVVSHCSIREIPTILANLEKLEILNLSHNSISELPSTIQYLTQLKVLDCSFNQLKKIPSEIGGLTSLVQLIVNKNELKRIPKEIGQLTSLTLLNLSDNFIQDIPPEISSLQSLRKLYLDQNELLNVCADIAQLTSLRELNLRANQLDHLPQSMVALTNLQILDLDQNEFKLPNYDISTQEGFMKFLKSMKFSRSSLRTRKHRSRKSITKKSFDGSHTKKNEDFYFVKKKKALYRLKGKRKILIRQVDPYLSSFNHRDAFVLDSGDKLFVWQGAECYYRKLNKAKFLAKKLASEQGRSIKDIEYIEDTKETDGFWDSLGEKGIIPYTTNFATDEEEEKAELYSLKLFKISEASGRIEIDAWIGEELSKDVLDSSACFVLDCQSFLFVWTGLYSSMSERSWAMLKAEELLAHGKRPSCCSSVIWMVDGNEWFLFQDQFFDWTDNSWDVQDKKMEKKARKVEKMHESTLGRQIKSQEKNVDEVKFLLEALEKEGYLLKKRGNEWIKRYFVLRNGILFRYQTDRDAVYGKPMGEITISDCSFHPYESDESGKSFKLVTQKKTIILQAESDTEMQVWINTILKQKILINEPETKTQLNFTADSAKNNLPKPSQELPKTEKKEIQDKNKIGEKRVPSIKPHKENKGSKELDQKHVEESKIKTEPIESSRRQESIKEEQQTVQDSSQIRKASQISINLDAPLPSESERIKQARQKSPQAKRRGDRKIAGPARRPPTKNAVKERQAIAERSDQLREESQLRGRTPSLGAVSARHAQMGGYGILYSIGADSYLFKKPQQKKEKKDEDFGPLLIQIKGRRRVYVRKVELCCSSLNSGDVFLLDPGKKSGVIYQWNGKEANRIEKGKAMDVAKHIKDKEHMGLSRVQVYEEGKETEDFWKHIPGSKSEIQSANTGGDDITAEKALWAKVKLFQVCHEENFENLELLEIGSGRLTKEMLQDESCYILDCLTELYVWGGKKSPVKIRNSTMKLAESLYQQREFWTAPLRREFPDAESVLFKEKFSNWSNIPIQMQQVVSGRNVAATPQQTKIDILKLHEGSPSREELMIDDGSGTLKIWKIDEFEKVEIEPRNYGEFYSGESYIVLYTYEWKNKESYLLYYWQGRNSTRLDKGSSALITVQMDDQLNRMAKEIRVIQNKEPKHFLTLFKKNFVVHLGKQKQQKPKKRLYQVFGKQDYKVRAIEVENKAERLESRSVFIAIHDKSVFLWKGKNSTVEEFECAKNVVTTKMNEEFQVVEEDSEPATFWDCFLEGKKQHICLEERRLPRIFQCSTSTGIMQVDEIIDFCQDDLDEGDVFILDTVKEVFVWIGRRASEREKKFSLEIAVEYARQSPQKRFKCPVWVVEQNKESISFIGQFHGWDGPYSDLGEKLVSAEEILQEYDRTYSYEELVNKKFPKGINTARLEMYLDDAEFEEIIGTTRDEFDKYPQWKQQKIKRELGLF